MQSWKHESIFVEYVAEEDHLATAFLSQRRRSSVNTAEGQSVLQNTLYALQKLQLALVGHEFESSWANQLVAYIQQLQPLTPARSSEEQFNRLYQLRKWLFWTPISLLQRQGGQGPAMLTLAHFYATALALEPLFPDLGSSFCSAMSLPPLEAIVRVTDAMQSSHGTDASSTEIASLMQYPRQTALSYRAHATQAPQTLLPPDTAPMPELLGPDTLRYTGTGNLSPAFAPSTPHHGTSTAAAAHPSPSFRTPFLEVPPDTSTSSFTYGTQSWGAMPSPGFPPAFVPQRQEGQEEEEQVYDYGGVALDYFRGGCVPPPPPPPVWT